MPYDGPPPDYREVPERIAEWYAREPNGRIVCEIVEFTETRVVVKAEVYRDDEELPAGVGHSYLMLPGSTPFTRGSELENAETSAAGRALVMAGIPAKNVASGQEIASKSARQAPPPSPASDGAAPVESLRADTAGAAPISSGGEGDLRSSSVGDVDGSGEATSNPPTSSPDFTMLVAPQIAGPKDWAQASRELKTSGTITRDLVLRHLKSAYGVKSLEEIDTDMLRQAVSALVLAKRTVGS